MEFYKWKSINKFSDAYAMGNRFQVGEMIFRGKIKLHGTNAAICFDDENIYAQSRSKVLSVYDDNAGFANFVAKLDAVFPDDPIVIYGEWAGPGVQKNDAVTNIDKKTFFAFSLYYPNEDRRVIEPKEIEDVISTVFGDDYTSKSIKVLPWYTEEELVDFSRQNVCQKFVDKSVKEVDEVIAIEDPYIKSEFDVSGPGEGLVYYAIRGNLLDGKAIEDEFLIDYIFKIKSEAHGVQKSKNRNHVAPERPDGIDEFIEMFFTENRMEQMLRQIGNEATRENTGKFIKAVMTDVYKESTQEVLISDFEWKDVPKYAAPHAKKWWFNKCDELG